MPNQDPNQNQPNTNPSPAPMHTDDLPPLPPDFQTVAKEVSNEPTSQQPQAVSNSSEQVPSDATIPPNLPPIVTSSPKKKFAGGRIIATILGLVVLVGGVGAGILLTQQKQVSPQAGGYCTRNNQCDSGVCSSNGTCGSCNANSCGPGRHCQGGQCRDNGPSCTGTLIDCGGNCVNPQSDNNNCGSCGHQCTTGTTCQSGTCSGTIGACGLGETQCGNGCKNLHTDPSNCGSCGQVCSGSTPSCNNGQCSNSCSSQQVRCNGICTNIITDNNNCGGCGIQCTGGATCMGSQCTGGSTTGPDCGGASSGQSCTTGADCHCQGGDACTSKICEPDIHAACTNSGRSWCKNQSGNGMTCCAAQYVCNPNGNGCVPKTGTPGGTTPPSAPSCVNVKAYSSTWTLLSNTDLPKLAANSVVNFCVAGAGGTFDKAQFKINATVGGETTTKRPSSSDFCQSYTILNTDTTITVKAKIHDTSGWVGESF